MSVNTRTSEMLDEARKDLDNAIAIISRIISDKPWGYEDYDPVKLVEKLSALMQARQKL